MMAIFFAILLIGLTLFIRLWLSPNIDSLRPQLESYLSTQLQMVVRMDRITATQNFHFEIEHLRVMNSDQQTALSLGRIGMNLHPLSLLQGKVDQLVIDAPELHVLRDKQGLWHIGGIAAPPSTEPSALLDWMFSQTEIVIQNGKLHFQDDLKQQPALTLTEAHLLLRNGLRSHDLRLDAKLPAAWGDSLQWIGRFTAPVLSHHAGQWQHWSGAVYAKWRAPQLSSLFAYLPPTWQTHASPLKTFSQAHSTVSADSQLEAWGDIHQTKLTHAAMLGSNLLGFAKRLEVSSDLSTPLTLQMHADLASPDIRGRAAASWRQTKQPWGWLDAKLELTHLELPAIARYWDSHAPANAAPSIKQYLQSALKQGQVEDFQLKLKGELADFPFAETKSGALSAQGKFLHLESAFLPEWPHLAQASGYFEWRNAQLRIDHIQTDFAGVPLQGSIQIADVRQPTLDIQAKTSTPLAQLMTGVTQIPILGEARRVLSSMQATGASDTAFNLQLPLGNLKQSKISGSVQFQGNQLRLRDDLPEVTDLKGRVQFSESNVSSSSLVGKALGGSFKLSGNLQTLTGSGTASIEALKSLSSKDSQISALLASANGLLNYSLEAKPLATTGAQLRVISDLTGLSLDLPEPVQKAATSAWPSELRFSLVNNEPHVSLSVGSVLDAYVQRVQQQWRGEVAVGTSIQRTAKTPDQLSLHIALPQLDITAWQPFLTNTKTAASTPIASAWMPSIISAQIQDLIVNGRHFEQVIAGASRTANSPNTWRINAFAKDFNGYAEYRGRTGELYARLARLAIPDASSKAQLESLLDNRIDALPGLDVVIEALEMTGKKLGRLELQALNQQASNQLSGTPQSEWRLQKLVLIHPEAALHATGVWSKPTPSSATERSRVNVQFQWDIQNAGDLLTHFGLAGTLQGGRGVIQGRIGWLGSPLALHYPSLTGQLKLVIHKGQFLKIDPGAGRLLAVISLQALPKLFKLDFRDVFSEGFAFDTVEGDARILDGVMETKNLQMKSSLALVSLEGNANLAKETQDLRVLVLPDVNAGGVSLLATIINPIVGAASYLAQLIFRRPLIAAATKEYRIQGTWRDPQVSTVLPSQP